MADVTAKRIDELPAASSVGDSDLFVLEQSGVAKKATGAAIATQFGGTAVLDVKIGSTSLVSSRIASIPDASSSTKGVTKVATSITSGGTDPVTGGAIYNALGNKADSSSVHSIPSGGTTGQVLKKTSGTDYAVEWANESGGGGGAVNDVTVDGVSVVTSGTAVIPKATSADFGVVKAYYAAASSPSGVDIAYIYNSTGGFSMPMLTPAGKLNVNYLQNGLPSGGTTGQILVKSSGTSYDVAWADAPTGGGGGVLGVTQDANGYLVLSPLSAVQEVDVSDTGAVTAALDAGKLYHFTGSITSLTITLNAAATGQIAEYHFDFVSGSTAATLTLPNTVVMPSGFSVAANTRYEIDILNNYGTVMSWEISA